MYSDIKKLQGWTLQLKTAPEEEPVSLAEMKNHLRVDSDITIDDTLISSLITAAREYVESLTARAVITQEWLMHLNQFPAQDYIVLPFGCLQSVTSIKTKDKDGVETTLTAATQYLVDTSDDTAGRVVLPYSVSWPSLISVYPYNPITIDFTCGYDPDGDLAQPVPESIKAAIKLLVGDMYENRESQVIGMGTISIIENKTAVNLLTPYRIWSYY